MSRSFAAALARVLAGAAALAGLCSVAVAAGPSPLPQPRVAYDMHGARINQIRATPDFERLVSVGQDKTLRVWRLRDLALLRTIHVPSEPGEEGSLRSLAITPDGREVIAGGWTGLAWSGQAQLYRFDLASGRLLQVLRGFPALVESLAISADGRRLAVGLGRGGLRVIELPSGRELAADADYAERVSFIDFSRDGALATTSADGCLRLYDAQHRMVFRAEYPPPADRAEQCRGAPLGGVRFSPDGTRLAFGQQERAEIVVMDVARRTLLARLSVDDPLQRALCCPNWSADGRRLHMHGAHGGDGPTPLWRVDLGSGAVERLPVGRQRFTNVLPLPDGDLVFSTDTPSLARIAPDGRLLAEALPPNGDFRFDWTKLRVSRDGRRVVLPLQSDGGAVRTLDLAAPADRAVREPSAADLQESTPPLRDGGVDAVLGDFGYRHPVGVAGQALALKPFQSLHAWARAPQGGAFALGTQWSVLMADAQGRRLWEQDLPAPARQVAFSGDGRWIVAAVGDGTLRWYEAASGQERLGAFLHAREPQWVLWRSDGYYSSSPQGDRYLGWLLNRGDDAAPDFVRAEQIERELYRPDLLAAVFEAPATRDARSAGAAGVAGLGDLSARLARLAPPRVRIESAEPSADGRLLRLRVVAEATGRPLRELGIYVDGLPLLRAEERVLSAAQAQRVERTLELPWPVAGARVRVEAETGQSLGVDETRPLREPPAAAASPGRLWVLAAGVHRFERIPGLRPLPFAPNDARTLAAQLAAQRGRAFADVQVRVVADGTAALPTKAALLSGLQWLKDARPEDTVLVFLASHGTTDASEYYFMTRDTEAADAERILRAQDERGSVPAGGAPSTLTASEILEQLRRVPGRRLLVIDTCESGVADGRQNPHTLLKRSASTQLAVWSAARGDQDSYESPDAPHGLFTQSLLQSLHEATGAPARLDALHEAVSVRVAAGIAKLRATVRDPRLRERVQQTPVLSAPPVLQQMVVAAP
ncbi:MAG: caspase family protein [Rubrivivax sp.]|nr:caspase family protein [Rubrivivax sp.]